MDSEPPPDPCEARAAHVPAAGPIAAMWAPGRFRRRPGELPVSSTAAPGRELPITEPRKLRAALRGLDARQRRIVELHYGLGGSQPQTLRQIGRQPARQSSCLAAPQPPPPGVSRVTS